MRCDKLGANSAAWWREQEDGLFVQAGVSSLKDEPRGAVTSEQLRESGPSMFRVFGQLYPLEVHGHDL